MGLNILAIFESIQNFITGDPNESSFGVRTTFFSGLVFAVAGIGIKTIADFISDWIKN